MADLVKPPELERQVNPLDPEADSLAPVEIRFQVRPEPGEQWSEEMASECLVDGQATPSPGAVLSFREWEKDEVPTLYCYALSRNLHEGDILTLRVHPRDKHHREQSEVVFERRFIVRVDGERFNLE